MRNNVHHFAGGSAVNVSALDALLKILANFYMHREVNYDEYSTEAEVVDFFSTTLSLLQTIHADENVFNENAVVYPLQAAQTLFNHFENSTGLNEIEIQFFNNAKEQYICKGDAMAYIASILLVYLDNSIFRFGAKVQNVIKENENLKTFYEKVSKIRNNFLHTPD